MVSISYRLLGLGFLLSLDILIQSCSVPSCTARISSRVPRINIAAERRGDQGRNA